MTTIPSSDLAAVTGGCGGGKQAQAPQPGQQAAAKAQGPAQPAAAGKPTIRDLLQAILAKLDGGTAPQH